MKGTDRHAPIISQNVHELHSPQHLVVRQVRWTSVRNKRLLPVLATRRVSHARTQTAWTPGHGGSLCRGCSVCATIPRCCAAASRTELRSH